MWQCVKTLYPVVNIKIAGKWMFIPLKMVLIGIDPYPCIIIISQVLHCFQTAPNVVIPRLAPVLSRLRRRQIRGRSQSSRHQGGFWDFEHGRFSIACM